MSDYVKILTSGALFKCKRVYSPGSLGLQIKDKYGELKSDQAWKAED